jgi:hypothetical protein
MKSIARFLHLSASALGPRHTSIPNGAALLPASSPLVLDEAEPPPQAGKAPELLHPHQNWRGRDDTATEFLTETAPLVRGAPRRSTERRRRGGAGGRRSRLPVSPGFPTPSSHPAAQTANVGKAAVDRLPLGGRSREPGAIVPAIAGYKGATGRCYSCSLWLRTLFNSGLGGHSAPISFAPATRMSCPTATPFVACPRAAVERRR